MVWCMCACVCAVCVGQGLGDGGREHYPGSENLLANEYLSSFKVASYVTKEVQEEVNMQHIKLLQPLSLFLCLCLCVCVCRS